MIFVVIPAKAGIQTCSATDANGGRISASAGMTDEGRVQ
jgi:hypothetical protein